LYDWELRSPGTRPCASRQSHPHAFVGVLPVAQYSTDSVIHAGVKAFTWDV
jgi:hypothetical protein